jgi:hypothetical protein
VSRIWSGTKSKMFCAAPVMPLTKTQIRHATPSRPAWGFFVFKTRSNSNVIMPQSRARSPSVINRLVFQNSFHGQPAVGFLFCHDDRRADLNPPPEGGSKKRAGAAITHDLISPTPATRPVLIGQGKPNPSRRSGK